MTIIRGLKLNGGPRLREVTLITPPPPVGGGPPVVEPPGNNNAGMAVATPDNFRVFQRDVHTGNPPGFSTTFGRGYGAVPVSVTPTATAAGIWMRLYNGETGTATNGTGTLVQPSILVSGTPTMPANVATTINLTVPAGDVLAVTPVGWYWIELALNAAFTNPFRIPVRIGVGSVFALLGQTSHSSAFNGFYPYTVPVPITTILTPSPYAVGYMTGAGVATGTFQTNVWQTFSDTGPYDTTGGAELLNRCIAKLGVVCALVGMSTAGTTLDGWTPSVLTSGNMSILTGMLNHTKDSAGKYKIEAALIIAGTNDSKDAFAPNPGRTAAARMIGGFLTALDNLSTREMTVALVPRPQARDPDVTSRAIQYEQANQDVALTRSNSTVNPWHDPCWGTSGHMTMVCRRHAARNVFRQFMLLMGPSKGGVSVGRGPRVTSASRTGAVITFHVTHDGGTALTPTKNTENATDDIWVATGSITAADLATFFIMYPPGTAWQSGTAIALAASNQVVLGTDTITVTLAADPGATVAFDTYFGARSNTQIRDNYIDDGIPYGRELQTNLTPFFVPAPAPAAQTITVNAPRDTAVGAYIMLNGAGSGTPLAGAGTGLKTNSIEVSVANGPWIVPDFLVVRNNNSWSGLVRSPGAVAAGVSVRVRRTGQTSPDASTTVNIVAARDILPASIKASAVALYDASNISTLWQDIAKTTPTTDLAQTRVWQDSLGTATNDVVQTNANALLAPYYAQRLRNQNFLDDPAYDRPAMVFESKVAGAGTYSRLTAVSPAVASVTGDITIVIASRNFGFGVQCWLGKSGGAFIQAGVDGSFKPGAVRKGTTGAALPGYPTPALPGGLLTLIARYVASTGMLTVNRTDGTSVQTSYGPVADRTAIFDTLILGGDLTSGSATRMHEVIVLNRAITDAEVVDVKTHVTDRWGTA